MISAVWFQHRIYSVRGLEKDMQWKVSSVFRAWWRFPAATKEARSLIEWQELQARSPSLAKSWWTSTPPFDTTMTMKPSTRDRRCEDRASYLTILGTPDLALPRALSTEDAWNDGANREGCGLCAVAYDANCHS